MRRRELIKTLLAVGVEVAVATTLRARTIVAVVTLTTTALITTALITMVLITMALTTLELITIWEMQVELIETQVEVTTQIWGEVALI
jgi:hypothetical protein